MPSASRARGWPSRPAGEMVALAASAADTRLVLGYTPVDRVNPFQSLLYSRAFAHGVAPVPLRTSEIGSLSRAVEAGGAAALHVHWTYGITGGSDDPASAVTGFLREVEALKAAGVALVWTVHNAFPHETADRAAERDLRAGLVRLADAIHVMNPATAGVVADDYPIPAERAFTVGHPSYRGAYPEHPDRPTARLELGLMPDDLVLAVVGSLRSYKGLGEFAAAFTDARARDEGMRAIVAGRPGDGVDDVLSGVPGATIIARRLRPVEVTAVLRAADAVVLPYRASLNSGAAMLAMTFGRPIVAPRLPAFAEILDRGLGVGYGPDDPAGLTEALVATREFVAGFDEQAALAHAARHDPEVVSEGFFDGLWEKLDRRG